MFKIISNRKIWYSISIISVIISAIFLILFGLRVGVDYKGGTILDLQSNNKNLSSLIEDALKTNSITTYEVKPLGSDSYSVRMSEIDNTTKDKILNTVRSSAPDTKELSFDNVGPSVGESLRNKSIYAVIVASLAIIIFIAYSFRKIPKPLNSWKFGLFAVLALAHDLFVTTGLVSLLGHYFVWMEVDVLFITALLTIMGFSVHDTIVIYDRLRENFIKKRSKNIEEIAEESINQTIARSINTSVTTIIVLFA